jgi:hypothetical protein
MNKITLQRNMDNGYGEIFCVQKQDFDLNSIHEYFKESLNDIDHSFVFDQSFIDVDSVVIFLKNNWTSIIDGAIMTDLDITDSMEYFHSTCNPKGFGNSVDCLVLSYNGEVLFESAG